MLEQLLTPVKEVQPLQQHQQQQQDLMENGATPDAAAANPAQGDADAEETEVAAAAAPPPPLLTSPLSRGGWALCRILDLPNDTLRRAIEGIQVRLCSGSRPRLGAWVRLISLLPSLLNTAFIPSGPCLQVSSLAVSPGTDLKLDT